MFVSDHPVRLVQEGWNGVTKRAVSAQVNLIHPLSQAETQVHCTFKHWQYGTGQQLIQVLAGGICGINDEIWYVIGVKGIRGLNVSVEIP